MKTLFFVLLSITSFSTMALDCTMYEGKRGTDLSGRTFRFTDEIPLEKEISCAGHCLYLKNEIVSATLSVSNSNAKLFTNFDGLELVAELDLIKGKMDSIKQAVKREVLGEIFDYSVVCDDLTI